MLFSVQTGSDLSLCCSLCKLVRICHCVVLCANWFGFVTVLFCGSANRFGFVKINRQNRFGFVGVVLVFCTNRFGFDGVVTLCANTNMV